MVIITRSAVQTYLTAEAKEMERTIDTVETQINMALEAVRGFADDLDILHEQHTALVKTILLMGEDGPTMVGVNED